MILIVTLNAHNYSSLTEELRQLQTYKFDYVEFRMDYYEDDYLEAIRLIKTYEFKILATNRFEGESRLYNEDEYIQRYMQVLPFVDMIDIEINRLNDHFKELITKTKVVGSFHNFDGVSVPWNELRDKGHRFKLTYLKIAVMINKKTDLLTLRNRSVDCCIGMGELGQDTRVNWADYNSEIVYCSLKGNSKIGQLPLSFYQ